MAAPEVLAALREVVREALAEQTRQLRSALREEVERLQQPADPAIPGRLVSPREEPPAAVLPSKRGSVGSTCASLAIRTDVDDEEDEDLEDLPEGLPERGGARQPTVPAPLTGSWSTPTGCGRQDSMASTRRQDSVASVARTSSVDFPQTPKPGATPKARPAYQRSTTHKPVHYRLDHEEEQSAPSFSSKVKAWSRRSLSVVVSGDSGNDNVVNFQEPGRLRRGMLIYIVDNPWFEMFFTTMLFLNALFIGIQINYHATTLTHDVPVAFRVMDTSFCVVFLVELICRICGRGTGFFTRSDRKWNLFDTFVVAVQVVDEFMTYIGNAADDRYRRVTNVMRLLRVMRVARIARVRELRTLVSSIAHSLKALAWTALLFLLLVYMTSVFLLEIITAYRIAHPMEDGSPESMGAALAESYGSLPQTMLSLFGAVSGGRDWEDLMRPVTELISPLLALPFVFYISFSVLCLMNVVTGVFVESVTESRKRDLETYLVNQLCQMLSEHGGWTTSMTLEDFKEHIDSKPMQEFFRVIGADVSDAERLFHVVDVDESGEVSAEEFFTGCVRLYGNAKAFDSGLLLQAMNRVQRHLYSLRTDVHKLLLDAEQEEKRTLTGISAGSGQHRKGAEDENRVPTDLSGGGSQAHHPYLFGSGGGRIASLE